MMENVGSFGAEKRGDSHTIFQSRTQYIYINTHSLFTHTHFSFSLGPCLDTITIHKHSSFLSSSFTPPYHPTNTTPKSFRK